MNFKHKEVIMDPAKVEEIKRAMEIRRKNLRFLESLGIPHFHGEFSIDELAEILSDEEKVRTILVKIRNKALL